MAGTFGYELDPAKLSEEENTQIQVVRSRNLRNIMM